MNGRTDGLSRRGALRALGVASVAGLAACGTSGNAADATAGGSTPETDPSLSALTLSSGSLTPAFDADVTSYGASVANVTGSIAVTAGATATTASVAVQGVAVPSGSSATVSLAVGANVVTIVVTAADGVTTRTYTIVVTRASSTCTIIPNETQGPYPLSAVLADPAIVRADITEDRAGVPLTLVLSLVDVNDGCAPIANAAVYVWHCDKDGAYSGYSSSQNGSHAGETFLRGVQTSNAAGQVQFTTIYPGWYAGRITHIHFQIFLQNNTGGGAEATSQIAFPQAVTQAVYASSLYAARGQNTSVASFAQDNVFSDGVDFQLATVSGSVAAGYTAALTVGVAV
ncbi:MAG: cadherin-like beta sandwich domain-containing protein [Planctomycetes bacterium]|nr:cadherin-like beta sandwich domain-containing protein [Planctomycetota bacterium]